MRSMVGGGLSSRGVCLWHGVMTSSGWRGTGAEHGGGRAELSRSLFVARSRDVIGMERD